MAAQKGISMLIKAGDGGSPTEAFTTIAGLRSTSFTHNNESVDVTTKDSGGYRELLAAGGTKSVSVSGSGVFTDAAVEDTIRASAFADSLNNYEFVFPNGDKITAAFQITSYERAGEHNGEETYSLSFESSGTVTFTAA